MSLIDQIRKEDNEAFGKWFDRWYNKEKFEKEIIQANREGYKVVEIRIYDNRDIPNNPDKYTQRRLRDSKTVEKLKNKLGNGFVVSYNCDESTGKPFGIPTKTINEYISVSWKE